MLMIIIIILLLIYIVFYLGKMQLDKQVAATRFELQSSCVDLSAEIYRKDQIADLPESVQRYFKFALEDGQPHISSVYLKHDGQVKTALDKEWINIEGEQYFIAEEPGFLWKGRTVLYTLRDEYVLGKGKITVSLLNLFTLVEGEGPEYNQGVLLYWLGGSLWFPTNLLPSSRLGWSPINENTAELTFRDKEQVLSYNISFNAAGEITQLETRRHMGTAGLYTWISRVSNYQTVSGMKIPMRIEVFWKLDDGEHCYACFNVKNIHHN